MELSSEGRFVQFHHFDYVVFHHLILDYLLFVPHFTKLDYMLAAECPRIESRS